MSSKWNKIELSEEFRVMWREDQPPEVFCKKGVLRNFAKLTGKHLYQSPFFNKVAGLRTKKTFFTEQLWATASVNG